MVRSGRVIDLRGALLVTLAVSEAGERGVPAHLLMERGEVVKTLDVLARTHHIDVVMTASRRHDVEQRYFLRTVPQRLMAVLHCSLIIVRVVHLGLLAHPRQILVPVLGGAFDHAERAYLVSQLAAHFHAKLIVFHTLEAGPPARPGRAP